MSAKPTAKWGVAAGAIGRLRHSRHTARYVWLWVRSIPYIGNRFVCPCCGGRFRKFLTYGVRPRPNARCPRCGTLERHRLLWLYLKQETGLFSESLSVLHFAPEFIYYRALSSLPNLFYVTADIDSPLASVALDITRCPFGDETFDVILCSHVLEHVADDQAATREMYRVLKPDGWAIILSPVDRSRAETFEDPTVVSAEERERYFGQVDHVRVYGRDYVGRLERAGFTVRADYLGRRLPRVRRKGYAVKKNSPIYLCLKRPKTFSRLEGARASGGPERA